MTRWCPGAGQTITGRLRHSAHKAGCLRIASWWGNFAMAQAAPDTPAPGKDWESELKSRWSDVALPGFWSNLEDNAKFWAGQMTQGPFWTEANNQLDQWRTEYKRATGGDLLTMEGLPGFVPKSARARSKYCCCGLGDREKRIRASRRRAQASRAYRSPLWCR